MLEPALIPIRADRNVMCRRTLGFVGFNFTGAAFKAAVRQTPDASGSALVTLTTQTTDVQGVRLSYSGTDTIANHQTAGRLDESDVSALLLSKNPATGQNYTLTDNILLSIVGIRIDEATMQNASIFPFPAERGDDLNYAWDILITPSGGDRDKYAGGPFIVQGGVTT